MSVSAGELARQSLMVPAEDPATRLAIESLAGEEVPDSHHTFDGGGSMALGYRRPTSRVKLRFAEIGELRSPWAGREAYPTMAY